MQNYKSYKDSDEFSRLRKKTPEYCEHVNTRKKQQYINNKNNNNNNNNNNNLYNGLPLPRYI